MNLEPRICPSGYSNYGGPLQDVQGKGLEHGYSATLEECKVACNARADCGSFSHSPTQPDSCKLMGPSKPTGSKWKDFVFCSKRNILI